ncbi:MAG: CD3324 family protein [Oscillospiraceae bacterium]
MNYINANKALPEALIKEIQKYVDGEIIYIPSKSDKKAWGQKNGTKEKYEMRNKAIFEQYNLGATIEKLSEDFYLSTDSIKKIIRKDYNDKNCEFNIASQNSAIA